MTWSWRILLPYLLTNYYFNRLLPVGGDSHRLNVISATSTLRNDMRQDSHVDVAVLLRITTACVWLSGCSPEQMHTMQTGRLWSLAEQCSSWVCCFIISLLKKSQIKLASSYSKIKRNKYESTNFNKSLLPPWQGGNYERGAGWSWPLEESSSMGCLKAVMSLKVHRKRTTFSCSFRIGAILTKNHTGVPER